MKNYFGIGLITPVSQKSYNDYCYWLKRNFKGMWTLSVHIFLYYNLNL